MRCMKGFTSRGGVRFDFDFEKKRGGARKEGVAMAMAMRWETGNVRVHGRGRVVASGY